MYAHQVIEWLTLWEADKERCIPSVLKDDLQALKKSQFFHVNYDSIKGVINQLAGIRIKKLDGWPYRLPYKYCWFDFDINIANLGKVGVLAFEDEEKRTVFKVFIRYIGGGWARIPIEGEVCINTNSDFYGAYNIGKSPGFGTNIDSETEKGFYTFSGFLFVSLMLLGCKNITTEKVHPPEKLNHKRRMLKKQPLFTYHTLVIKPTGKHQESIPKHLWENRIHLCRGHFKTYTADNPLFGKFTGRYWWQPAVRGNKNLGVVMKDYKVESASV